MFDPGRWYTVRRKLLQSVDDRLSVLWWQPQTNLSHLNFFLFLLSNVILNIPSRFSMLRFHKYWKIIFKLPKYKQYDSTKNKTMYMKLFIACALSIKPVINYACLSHHVQHVLFYQTIYNMCSSINKTIKLRFNDINLGK